jgi:hypothetical protein
LDYSAECWAKSLNHLSALLWCHPINQPLLLHLANIAMSRTTASVPPATDDGIICFGMTDDMLDAMREHMAERESRLFGRRHSGAPPS